MSNSDSHHRRAVDTAVDQILGNLSGPLDLATLSARAGYSPWHFQRVFHSHMGESPSVFVVRARVERAVAIAGSDPSRAWRDIAWESGFASQSQLSRAFRQRYGKTPRSWDRVEPLIDTDHADNAWRAAARPGEARQVTVARMPSCRVGYRRVMDPYVPGNLTAAWEVVASWAHAGSQTLIGISWDDPATVPSQLCRYDLGVVCRPAQPLPEGASERWLPSLLAAVVPVHGDINAVAGAWEHLHRVWLPGSPYGRSALPAIERLHGDPRPSWEQWQLDCVLPVIRKGNTRRSPGG